MWSARRYQVEWDNLLEGSSYRMSYKTCLPLLSDFIIKECAKYRTSYSRVANYFLRQVCTTGHRRIWMRILWGQKWVMDRAAFVTPSISITQCDMFAGFLMGVVTWAHELEIITHSDLVNFSHLLNTVVCTGLDLKWKGLTETSYYPNLLVMHLWVVALSTRFMEPQQLQPPKSVSLAPLSACYAHLDLYQLRQTSCPAGPSISHVMPCLLTCGCCKFWGGITYFSLSGSGLKWVRLVTSWYRCLLSMPSTDQLHVWCWHW